MGKITEQGRHGPWIDGAMTPFPHPLKDTIRQMAAPDSNVGTTAMSSNLSLSHILDFIQILLRITWDILS